MTIPPIELIYDIGVSLGSYIMGFAMGIWWHRMERAKVERESLSDFLRNDMATLNEWYEFQMWKDQQNGRD